MKIAILTDTHFGCRKNSLYFMEQQKKFYDDYFFPYIFNNNIDTILHLGDFFDNRKTVNFETLRHAKECFINPIIEKGINLHMLVGNHDSYYKSNGDLTSTKLLFDGIPNISVYDLMSTIELGGKSFLMVPWIFPIQKEEISNIIRLNTADVCCGHFEMIGVVYQGSIVSRKGIDTDIFSHFPHVFSGHYHKKSHYYVGSPYQMTWNDYDDKKRIIVYDTDTDESEDIYISEDTFFKIEYPGDKESLQLHRYDGKIIRILVKSKDDPEDFEKFVKIIEEAGPESIDIKEEYLYLNIIEEDDLDEDADTLGVLLSSVDDLEDLKLGDKLVVKEIMKQLYDKAGE